jgi:hypothetical protein
MGVGVAAYTGTKLIAYIAVVYAGYRFLEPSAARPAWAAIAVGVARFIMGIGFGLLIYAASSTLFTSLSGFPLRSVITYVAVYVPTRWLEWSVIALVIAPSARSWTGFLFGTAPADRWWRLLGIVVSCAADIPLMLTLGGLPLGRFLC